VGSVTAENKKPGPDPKTPVTENGPAHGKERENDKPGGKAFTASIKNLNNKSDTNPKSNIHSQRVTPNNAYLWPCHLNAYVMWLMWCLTMLLRWFTCCDL
jgi:hypothetical protein